jgi:hypothetical protein
MSSSTGPKWSIKTTAPSLAKKVIVSPDEYDPSRVRITKPISAGPKAKHPNWRIYMYYLNGSNEECMFIIGPANQMPLDMFSWGITVPKKDENKAGSGEDDDNDHKYRLECFFISKEEALTFQPLFDAAEAEYKKKREEAQTDEERCKIEDLYKADTRIINGNRLISQNKVRDLLNRVQSDVFNFIIDEGKEIMKEALGAKPLATNPALYLPDRNMREMVKPMVWNSIIQVAEADNKGDRIKPKLIMYGKEHKEKPNAVLTKFFDVAGKQVMPTQENPSPASFAYPNYMYVDTTFIFDSIFIGSSGEKFMPQIKTIDATIIPLEKQASKQRTVTSIRSNPNPHDL